MLVGSPHARDEHFHWHMWNSGQDQIIPRCNLVSMATAQVTLPNLYRNNRQSWKYAPGDMKIILHTVRATCLCVSSASRADEPGGELKLNKWQLPAKSAWLMRNNEKGIAGRDCCFHLYEATHDKGEQICVRFFPAWSRRATFSAPWWAAASLEDH